MIITHLNKTPQIHPSAYVAPNATISGDVIIGASCRIMYGACVIAQRETLELGENCIVMENAVIRSTNSHPTKIGSHCLIGPHAHVVGCTLEDCVFIATGASIFHGARLGYGSEVRPNGVVHLRSHLPPHTTVPINWVAVGDPAQIFPPDRHDEIWAIQKPLNFPKWVYGFDRSTPDLMRRVTRRLSEALGAHAGDTVIDG